jgi:hypothetical protein
MFGTIRKHQTWLWAVIITLTVISFVVYFSPYSRMNAGFSRQYSGYGSINGEKVTDQMYRDAYREWDLHTFLNSGHWLNEDRKRTDPETEQQEVYRWLLLNQKQEQYSIHVSDSDTADMARQILTQRFGREASPAVFIQRALQPRGYGVGDLERYVRHFVGLNELINAVGVAGRLVTPQEAQELYQRQNQQLATAAVFFSASNHLDSVVATPDQISQYYSNRAGSVYAVPERVIVDYVKFNVTNFLPQAQTDLSSNLNEVVESNFQQLGTNGVPGTKTPEEAKAKIREQLLRRQALMNAAGKAKEFYQTLSAIESAKPENLRIVAASNGLPVSVSAPFDAQEGPKDLEVPAEFAKLAFALTPEEPFSQPIAAPDGIYIMSLNKRLPREIPPLDQVRARVVADYKHGQAMNLAHQTASAFYATWTNASAQGKAFTNICAEQNVKPVELPPFSLSTQHLPEVEDRVSLTQLKQAAFGTQPGKLSPPMQAVDGFFVLYVKNKLPLDQEKMKADLPAFVNNVRRERQQEAFDEWLRREVERGLLDTPLFHRSPPNLGSAPSKT